MKGFAAVLIATTLGIAVPASAQMPSLGEAIEVRIINIDVVVTDRKGTPVTTLGKDDFEVYENGELREITNFYRMEAADDAAAAPGPSEPAKPRTQAVPRRNRIVLFVDNLTVSPFNRKRAIQAMKSFLKTSLAPGDEVMVASWNHSLSIDQPFTSSIEAASATLDGLEAAASGGAVFEARRAETQRRLVDMRADYALQPLLRPGGGAVTAKPPYEQGLREVTRYSESVAHDERETIAALRGLMASLAPLQERKVLVLLTESSPAHPGIEMFQFFDAMKDEFEGSAGRSPLADAAAYRLTGELASLTDAANAAGFAMYPLHLAPGDAAASVEGGILGQYQAAATEAKRSALDTDAEALQFLAKETGGVPLLNTTNYEAAFENIRRDLASSYSLGYKAGGEKSNRLRSVEVRIKKGKYNVRTRRAFVEKSAASEVKEIVAANLFYPNRSNDMKVFATAGAPAEAEGDAISLPLTVTIPMSSFTLLPDGDDVAGRFSVYVAFLKKDGAVSDTTNQTHELRFPAVSLKNRKDVTLKLTLTMDKATDRLSVGVLDETSKQTGFTTYRMAAP